MDTEGRKRFRLIAGALIAAMLLCGTSKTAVAGRIGLIDTKEPLDIFSSADDTSETLGKAVNGAHVNILMREDGWVQILAGTTVGWIPEENLKETELTVEEAARANREIIADLTGEENEEKGEFAEEEESTEEENTEETENITEESAEEASIAEGEIAEEMSDMGEAGAEEVQLPEETLSEELLAAQTAELLLQQEAQRQAAELLLQQEAQRQAEELRLQQEAQRQAEELLRQQQEEALRQSVLETAGATEDDLYLLANIIYCEAGGESYEGKVAVGSVVMNRVQDAGYPNTIREVIYDAGQFSPVRNGSLKRALKKNRADESCYQAALDALNGSRPVGGCLYFRRANGRSGLILGHHVFY